MSAPGLTDRTEPCGDSPIGSYLLSNSGKQAGGRFDALGELFNEWTFRHLDEIGVAAGWHCWEVGAGGPSVPAFLADRVGPSGHVVASDIDPSWLGSQDQGFSIVRHDVVNDAPPGRFDLIHARLVLTHLPGRSEALAHMVSALRPGGWLVVEDFDIDIWPVSSPDNTSEAGARANRIRGGFTQLLIDRGVDTSFGRALPGLLRNAGLTNVEADAYLPLARRAGRHLDIANIAQLADQLRTVGQDNTDIDRHLEALNSTDLDIGTPPLVTAWGRSPHK